MPKTMLTKQPFGNDWRNMDDYKLRAEDIPKHYSSGMPHEQEDSNSAGVLRDIDGMVVGFWTKPPVKKCSLCKQADGNGGKRYYCMSHGDFVGGDECCSRFEPEEEDNGDHY